MDFGAPFSSFSASYFMECVFYDRIPRYKSSFYCEFLPTCAFFNPICFTDDFAIHMPPQHLFSTPRLSEIAYQITSRVWEITSVFYWPKFILIFYRLQHTLVLCYVVATIYPYSGLSPVRLRPYRAHQKKRAAN